ncbi:serine hydrolase [Tenacibaculum aiptasiae]|uniref:serine hydrolase n=1 Tax=Tenacibaculum aiptasiae TaxID=426481 RepID=UPI00232E4422|nr:serine hydrolase [Tenacibaculum aiptasiae]
MKKLALIILLCSIKYSAFSQTNSNKKLEDSIHQVFESYAHYNRFIGNVLISKNDTIIYNKSFGYANADSLHKNTKNSIFSIASITKPLTAVGIMKLVEQGKLTLETPISTYFPNFIPNFSKKITIRHLLNHSSGMQANIGRKDNQGNGLMPTENPISLNNLIEKFKDSKLKHEPGKGYEYNNFGYTLLAYIIENITKLSYVDFMEQAVFKPANMKSTAVNSYKVLKHKTFPHIGLGFNSFTKLNKTIHSSWLMGAGNINSTTKDLYNFMKALENGVLLAPSSVKKLYNYTQSRGVNNSEYGLGWRIENKGGEKWINHTGLLPGLTSIIGTLPQKNIKIIILSNATTTDLITESSFQGKNQFVDSDIIDNLIATIQGKKPKLLPKTIQINNSNIANFCNTYMLDNKHSLLLRKQGNQYSLETIGKEAWSIFTYKFSRDTKKNTKAIKTALFFANAMSSQNFKGLCKYANEDMKKFLGSEKGLNQLKGMWKHFIKNAGTFKSYNIYNAEGEAGNKTVKIRFHFEKEDVGFVLGINAKNQIQGMFMDDQIRTSSIRKVTLTQVSQNEFFINGHHNNGMQDLKIKIRDKGLTLIDGNTSFSARVLPSL